MLENMTMMGMVVRLSLVEGRVDQRAAWKVFMIFIFKKHSNKNNKREKESAQFCQVQTLNRKQDPTKPKRKITTYMWSPIRDNDRQLPLIGSHTRPNTKK